MIYSNNDPKPLENLADIRQLVDGFYEKVKQDALLAPVFEAVIQDWREHLPTMYQFWDSILFGTMTYQGNPFAKHIPLPISKIHFDRWLLLFTETVDSLFTGEKAEEAKQRASSIAGVFNHKLEMLRV